ncbi:hypothetical protein EHF33_19510 (plasmid) [Deinococcus psychrotolerans]|uniref:HTH luxR-type domain-containing protein n=1 Tax=Deinococcus psychrotolerans TaxID=2489213 RepID=A0A3G8YJD6_9DEIO|nr:LuxR C-terminal-related transcriptional regulator [Deinococcus psychrotolerans]AZI45073.1 hypothetical protein EHF33_19510 [Deinococcus psychrotolerans]
MALTLLSTKLHPPLPTAHVIARPHLVARLERGIGAKLMLISSPAGTGKSTLLAAWLRQQSRPAAWLSLDKSDNDLGQFLLYLVSALQQLDPDLGVGLPELLQQQNVVSFEPLLIRLTNNLAQLGGKVILVLDDYHFLSDSRIHDATEFLLDHLPSQVCLVIVTRTDPPLALSRLRVRSQLLEVRGADLRFDLAEVAHFLNGSQELGLSPAAIASLEAQTEGWIAALQLAALSLAERPDKEAFVEAFVGSHRFLVDYLVDEVLSRQPASIKTFLQRTAILERFNTSLCEAVTGQTTDADLLRQLEAANLFLVPLDDERRWYRFHHLFAEFLRHRLKADEPALIPELHRRASAWFAAQGLTDEAIRHAFLADDNELAAQVAAAVVAKLAVQWSNEQFIQYFQRLPTALIPAHPQLCLYYGWFLTTTGRLGTIKAALPLLEQSKGYSPEPQMLDAAIFGLRAYDHLHQLDFADAARLCQQQLSLLESAEPGHSTPEALMVRIAGTNLMGSICFYTAPQRAAALYQVALNLAQQIGSFISIFTATTGLAQANRQLGQLREAARVLEQGLRHLEDTRSQRGSSARTGNVAELHARLGQLHYERNQLAEAGAALRQARKLNELYGSPLALALGLSLSLKLCLAEGEVEAAYTALHRLDEVSVSVHGSDALLKQTFEVLAMHGRLALLAQTPQLTHLLDEVKDWLESCWRGNDEHFGSPLSGHDILARLRLARNEPTQALPLLERLIEAAQDQERENDLIRFLLLQALALQQLNREGEAMQALIRALKLAEPEGYCRSFIDLGPQMQALLKQRARDRNTPYLAALLAAFPERSSPLTAPEQPQTEVILQRVQGEVFNARELAVLRLLEVGNTHKQIARELQLSPNTVRWYMKNLYLKLRANNRTGALNRAREMGLL